MLDTKRPETAFAIDTVRKAAMLAHNIRTSPALMGLTKTDASPVTVADYALQAVAAHALSVHFPEDRLVAEEGADALRSPESADLLAVIVKFVQEFIPGADGDAVCALIGAGAGSAAPEGRFWTLDPIDGTKGYLRGGQYAVALALLEGGQVQIGALGCPELRDDDLAGAKAVEAAPGPEATGSGTLAAAVRGEGAWLGHLHAPPGGWRRLRVSARANPGEARLLRSYEASHTNTDQIEALRQALGTAADPVAMDSQAKYILLAAGEAELLVRLLSPKRPDYREMIWDQAAGALLLEEAGGRITDLRGAALDFTQGRTLAQNTGVLATNGLLHDAALEAIARLG